MTRVADFLAIIDNYIGSLANALPYQSPSCIQKKKLELKQEIFMSLMEDWLTGTTELDAFFFE